MKEIIENNERRADGVYFVRSASNQSSRDEALLYMQVSDGKILRTAMQFAPIYDTECVRERFFQITGIIDSDEILMIEDMDDDVDISKLNLPEFFVNRQIPVEIIFRYFFLRFTTSGKICRTFVSRLFESIKRTATKIMQPRLRRLSLPSVTIVRLRLFGWFGIGKNLLSGT